MTTSRTGFGKQNGSAAPSGPDEPVETHQDEQAAIAQDNVGDVSPEQALYEEDETARAAASIDALNAEEIADVQAPPRPGPEVQAPAPDVEIRVPAPPSTNEPSPDIRVGEPPPAPPSDPTDAGAAAAGGDEDPPPAPFDPSKIQEEFAEAIAGAHGEYWINYFRRLKTALDAGEGGAIELALPSETIDINREIECEIYAHRSMRLAGSPTARVALTLTFDGVRHARLSGLLGANLKGRVNITVNNLQAPLEEEDERALPEAGVLRQLVLVTSTRPPGEAGEAEAPPADVHATDAAGNVYKAHPYAPASEDPAKCALCGAGESHALHEGKKRQTKRNALARRKSYLIEHPFEPAPAPSVTDPDVPIVCVYCELPEADEIHSRGAGEIPTYADRVAFWIADGLEEPMAHEKAQDEVNAGAAAEMTEADRLAYKLLNEGDDRHAIERQVDDELEEPVRDEDLTEEQRDARRRLADKSGDA